MSTEEKKVVHANGQFNAQRKLIEALGVDFNFEGMKSDEINIVLMLHASTRINRLQEELEEEEALSNWRSEQMFKQSHLIGRLRYELGHQVNPVYRPDQPLTKALTDDIQIPMCDICGSNSQVWKNQQTDAWTCHRVGCNNHELSKLAIDRMHGCDCENPYGEIARKSNDCPVHGIE